MRDFREFMYGNIAVAFTYSDPDMFQTELFRFLALCEENDICWQSGSKATDYPKYLVFNDCIECCMEGFGNSSVLVYGSLPYYSKIHAEIVHVSEFLTQEKGNKMNYIPELMKLIGISTNEEFHVRTKYGLLLNGDKDPYVFHFDEENKLRKNAENTGFVYTRTLTNIITGEYEVVKLPFKPKNGDYIWYVTSVGSYSTTRFMNNDTFSLVLYLTGNCFKTEKDADYHSSTIMHKYKEILADLKG